MAKQDEFRYLSASVPEGEAKYRVIRWGWNGLNRTDKIDTGQLTDAEGCMADPPYMIPLKDPQYYYVGQNMEIISIHGFDKRLVIVFRQGGKIKVYVTLPSIGTSGVAYDGTGAIVIGNALGTDEDLRPRSVVQFNVVDTSSGNIATYTYDRKLLIYPDRFSIGNYYDPGSGENGSFNTPGNPIPAIRMAAVYGSRVFGVDDNSVYASAYNSYVDYTLDTADDTSSAHAWMSMSQSNTEADGAFTAIAAYDNHAVLFRKDFMQLVYNNKNPFRIVDVGQYGCDNPLAVTSMGGALYFASQNKVYRFTGGTPKVISDKLEAGNLSGAKLGAFGDTLWMQADSGLYTYKGGVWSQVGPLPGGKTVLDFTETDYGLCALLSDRRSIVFLDMDLDAVGEEKAPYWEPEYSGDWWFDTDLMALGVLDVRRAKKLSLLCEGRAGAEVSVWLMAGAEAFDPDSAVKVGTLSFPADGMKMLRVLTRQFSGTMHRLRIGGHGYVKVYAAEMKISWGGEVYVEG